MTNLAVILGGFLLVAVFGVLLGMTYFLAKTRVEEAAERREKGSAVPAQPKTAVSEDDVG